MSHIFFKKGAISLKEIDVIIDTEEIAEFFFRELLKGDSFLLKVKLKNWLTLHLNIYWTNALLMKNLMNNENKNGEDKSLPFFEL